MKRSTSRLELLVLMLLATSYVLQSAKLFLDRAILLADKSLQLQQHDDHGTFVQLSSSSPSSSSSRIIIPSSSTLSSSSTPSASAATGSLTWFLHFHKAAGSSFTDLALKNNQTFRDDRDNHGHLELSSHTGEFRWELLGGVANAADAATTTTTTTTTTTCWVDHENMAEWEQQQARVLGQEMASLRQQGVSFVSTEHWFPSHRVLQQAWEQQQPQQQQQQAPTMVVLLRDPVERILSSYAFHNRGGGRCSGTIGGNNEKKNKKKKRCDLVDWHKGEANMYVSMLNGIPFGPRKVGTACAPHLQTVGQDKYQNAVDSLNQHFQVVLTLDSIRQRPAQVACVLNKALKWKETTLPQKNRNSKSTNNRRAAAADYSTNIDPNVLRQVQDANTYDIQLYQHGQEMERRLFAQFGCNDDVDASIRQER